MSVSNKVAHLSNKEHSSIAKVSLCPFVPADVSEVMINYKSKRKEVSDAGKQSKQFKTQLTFSRNKKAITNQPTQFIYYFINLFSRNRFIFILRRRLSFFFGGLSFF